MGKKLLIVESPAKAKTIGKYLGGDFVVKSSVGHVRDLPAKGLGLAVAAVRGARDAWTFEAKYEISPDKKDVVADLRKAAAAADEIYLAPDPDREGEAIAWHLSEVLAKETAAKPVYRVTYNEITRGAVLEAVAHPREIDRNRVDAQQARRILDRLVGFKVSPLLWRHLNYGYSLSAGRVQSVALRLLVEREREVRAFRPESYWVMGAEAVKGGVGSEASFVARLARIGGEKADVRDETRARAALADLDGACLRVRSVKTRAVERHASPPFTTSSLQQAASGALGFSPKRTMDLAQKLYEQGLITYMRTDSVNVAAVARAQAAAYVRATYGTDYVPEKPNFYKSKSGAQEAHEAIRPTDVARAPGSFAIDGAGAKLYGLIWRRFLASQAANARLETRSVEFAAEKEGLAEDYLFTASSTRVLFPGFLAIMPTPLAKKSGEDGEDDGDEVSSLPELAEGERCRVARWLSDRKETKPPARYSEAALVKALEENGVGRPSTYAQTLETLVSRKYATLDARRLVPTDRGMDVNDWLVMRLPVLFDVGYTALMEERLDKVESGEEKYGDMLSGFYARFTAALDRAKDPPPPLEKFAGLFDFLSSVTAWREPVASGNRAFDDRAFVASLREQVAAGTPPVSARQLQALARVAISYRDQVTDGDARLEALGWREELDRVRQAPPADLVAWAFSVLDRVGCADGDFVASLRRQATGGKPLSSRQFAALAKTVAERAAGLDDAAEIRARLEPFVPGGLGEAPKVDLSVPGLLELLGTVTEWKAPVTRGKRTFDDAAFAKSLADSYAVRKTLTPRQAYALRRLCLAYKDRIPGFAERAPALGLDKMPAPAARRPRAVRRRARS